MTDKKCCPRRGRGTCSALEPFISFRNQCNNDVGQSHLRLKSRGLGYARRSCLYAEVIPVIRCLYSWLYYTLDLIL